MTFLDDSAFVRAGIADGMPRRPRSDTGWEALGTLTCSLVRALAIFVGLIAVIGLMIFVAGHNVSAGGGCGGG